MNGERWSSSNLARKMILPDFKTDRLLLTFACNLPANIHSSNTLSIYTRTSCLRINERLGSACSWCCKSAKLDLVVSPAVVAVAAWVWSVLSCCLVSAVGQLPTLFSTVCGLFYAQSIHSLISSVVDGGHRAIKYSRVSGVRKEIYAEGKVVSPTARTSQSNISIWF